MYQHPFLQSAGAPQVVLSADIANLPFAMAAAASNTTERCLNDDTFGPIVVGCRENFDFTLVFEQSVFSIIPSACFAVLALARIARLSRKPDVVSARAFQALKIVRDQQ